MIYNLPQRYIALDPNLAKITGSEPLYLKGCFSFVYFDLFSTGSRRGGSKIIFYCFIGHIDIILFTILIFF